MSFLDEEKFPDHLTGIARKLARHEMGHWAIARRLGFATQNVTARVNLNGTRNGGAEQTVAEDIGSLDDLVRYLERRIKVIWAGVISEALGGGNVSAKVDLAEALELLNSDGARGDARVAQELLQCVRNLKSNALEGDIQTQLKCISDRLWEESVALVEESSTTIVQLGEMLLSRLKDVGVCQEVTFRSDEIEKIPLVSEWIRGHALAPFVELMTEKLGEIPDTRK